MNNKVDLFLKREKDNDFIFIKSLIGCCVGDKSPEKDFIKLKKTLRWDLLNLITAINRKEKEIKTYTLKFVDYKNRSFEFEVYKTTINIPFSISNKKDKYNENI